MHIVQAVVLGPDGKTSLTRWTAQALSSLPKSAFANDYAYYEFEPGPFGIRAPIGAKATITFALPATSPAVPANAILKMTDVDGRSFTAGLHASASQRSHVSGGGSRNAFYL